MAPRWSAFSTARGGKLTVCRASLLAVVALVANTRAADAFGLSSQLHHHQHQSSAIATPNDIFDQDHHGYPRGVAALARLTAKPTRKTLIRMAGSEKDELERLRRENKRLKEELEGKKKKNLMDKFNPLKALGEIFLPRLKSAADKDDGDIKQGQTELVSSSSRRTRDKNRSMQRGGSGTASAIDEIFRDVPFPFNLAGGVVKGMARMMDETFQDAEDDVGLVMKATEESLRRDQQASQMLGGGDVTCLTPVGKSFSKSTINGVSSVSVGLQMPARGNGRMGSVSVRASVDADNARGDRVSFQSLKLTVDGRTISVKPNNSRGDRKESGAPGVGKGEGEVVDVEYTER